MQINEENDFQISDGMEYPPSYKERDLIDPPQELENPRPQPKDPQILPNFGKPPPRNNEKPSENKNSQGNNRKNHNFPENENGNSIPRPISSKKENNSSGKHSKHIPPKPVDQNEYNNFLEDSFSKLKLINNQMALMQAQKSKTQSKPFEKSESSLLEQFKAISYAYSNSQQKIVELEESLRIETINSEEQRAYIEVLKAALESKINDLGLMNFIKETAKYSKTNHLDLFVHFQNLKSSLDNQTTQTKTQDTKITELELLVESLQNELSQYKITNQELMDFNTRINSDIENSLKRFAVLEDENKKLKNEKNHVLDYLDEMTQKSEKLQKGFEDLMARLKEKDDFISNLQREIASLHKHIQTLESNQGSNNRPVFKGSSEPSSELVKELEGLKKKYQEMINRASEGDNTQENNKEFDRLVRENNILKADLEREKKRNHGLEKTQETSGSSPYKEKNSVLDRSFGKENIDVYRKENDFLKKENERLRDEIEQVRLQNSNLVRNLDERKRTAGQDESFRKREIERENDRLSAENRELKRKLMDLPDRSRGDLKRSFRKGEESTSPFRPEREVENPNNSGENNSKQGEESSAVIPEKDQKSTNFSKREFDSDLIEDLKTRLEREREQKSKEIKEIYDSLSNTRSELRDAKEEINGLKLKNENLENDAKTLQDLLEKKQKLLEQTSQELAETKKGIEAKNSDINASNKRIQAAKNEIAELQNMMGHWEKQLKGSNNERDGLVKELKDLNDENYRFKGQIKELNFRLDESKKINTEANERVKDYESKLKSLQGNMRNIVQGIRKEFFEGKKMKSPSRILDENATIEEVTKEIRENLNSLVEENEKVLKANKDLEEALKESEQTNLKKVDEMKKDNVALYHEIEKLTEDNNYLADEISKLKQENNNLIQELDERRVREEDQLNNEILSLEDKLVKIQLEKNQFEFLFNIARRFLFNGEVMDLINELKIVLSTFNTYEKQRIALEKLYEDLKNTNESDLNNSYYEISKRRKLDDYKDQISEIETNIKIQESKREILENELIKLENFENNRYRNIANLEKVHNQLKNEINILNNELDLKEMSRKNIENAYNDLLGDYKKLSEDTKKNEYGGDKYSDFQGKKESYRASDRYNTSFSDMKMNDEPKKTEESNYRYDRKYKKYD